MGQGIANIILEIPKVKIIAKKILLKYFKTLENKSAKELLEDTRLYYRNNSTKIFKMELLTNKFFNFIHCRI